ncbi:MAG: TetR/AcrR family transcriptional regulator C-terminal domain-containing protein [Mycobacteriales bacterium]
MLPGAALTGLARTGLSEADKMSAILVVTSYVRSDASLALDLARSQAESDFETTMPAYTKTMRRLAKRAEFPHLNMVLDAGVFDRPDDEFAFGLARILDGIAMLVDGSGTPSPRQQR